MKIILEADSNALRFTKRRFIRLAEDYQSSDILRRPHNLGPSSTYYLTLLSNVKKRVEDGINVCGLFRISEL